MTDDPFIPFPSNDVAIYVIFGLMLLGMALCISVFGLGSGK